MDYDFAILRFIYKRLRQRKWFYYGFAKRFLACKGSAKEITGLIFCNKISNIKASPWELHDNDFGKPIYLYIGSAKWNYWFKASPKYILYEMASPKNLSNIKALPITLLDQYFVVEIRI